MNPLEKVLIRLRHDPRLESASWLWDALRPAYDRLVRTIAARHGLTRNINGTDLIRVCPAARQAPEVHEPDVWPHVMKALRPGDTFVDVGANIGLYALAAANRVGPNGRVIVCEPDPVNLRLLRGNITVSKLSSRVEVIEAAIGASSGRIAFTTGNGVLSAVASGTSAGNASVRLATLDEILPNRRADVLKIDVEGYEEAVLRGAGGLLGDPARRPRAIFVEVHPFAWGDLGTTTESLLDTLQSRRYRATALSGRPVPQIADYGEIVATPLE